eukprot:TRINITY_DN2076_c0_g1_i5.p1 TRINITY_DN2076_c0_g1~~TRINITY_DN2076_c0_g1_i5.p1  ORF type:complete len:360 (+),score=45.16 TRINITY_DN2076_c0_g1_i5:513-1592(+)
MFFVSKVWHFYWLVPLVTAAEAAFWPVTQTVVGIESKAKGHMHQTLLRFSAFWSLGKTTGLSFGGFLSSRMGPSLCLIIPIALTVVVAFIFPTRQAKPAAEAETPAGDNLIFHDNKVDRAFRKIECRSDAGYITTVEFQNNMFLACSWVLQFTVCGCVGVVHTLYITLIREKGIMILDVGKDSSALFLGVFMGCVFAAQSLVFFASSFSTVWTYKRTLMYTAEMLIALCQLTISVLSNPWLLLCVAGLMGVVAGFSFESCLIYSLNSSSARSQGLFVGVSEALIAGGTFVFPLVGGILAKFTGDLRVPYWFAASVAISAIILQEALYRVIYCVQLRRCAAASRLPDDDAEAPQQGTEMA